MIRTRKYTEMSKTEYDHILAERFGQGVQVVDMGDGDIRVMRFIGYEDGDAEYEMDDSYPKAITIEACEEEARNADGCVRVSGIEGVVFV